MSDGSLAVGTGDSGKLYRVRAAGANADSSSSLVSTNQTHVISLAVTPKGELIAGTDSEAMLRVSLKGRPLHFSTPSFERFMPWLLRRRIDPMPLP